jgi:hypothetical protein
MLQDSHEALRTLLNEAHEKLAVDMPISLFGAASGMSVCRSLPTLVITPIAQLTCMPWLPAPAQGWVFSTEQLGRDWVPFAWDAALYPLPMRLWRLAALIKT